MTEANAALDSSDYTTARLKATQALGLMAAAGSSSFGGTQSNVATEWNVDTIQEYLNRLDQLESAATQAARNGIPFVSVPTEYQHPTLDNDDLDL